jgi:hypothetical protein
MGSTNDTRKQPGHAKRDRQVSPAEVDPEVRWHLIKELARLERLQEEIDYMFAGMAFNHAEPPMSWRNRQRFHRFFTMRKAVMKEKIRLIHTYMRTRGIDPDHLPVMPASQNSSNQSQQQELSEDELKILRIVECLRQHERE